jgi:hypothetical protein
MKVFRAAVVIALLACPAYAQDSGPHVNLMQDQVVNKTPEEKEAERERDRAYRESLKKIPDAKAASDPWGNVRNADAPRTSAPARSRTKTGSMTN